MKSLPTKKSSRTRKIQLQRALVSAPNTKKHATLHHKPGLTNQFEDVCGNLGQSGTISMSEEYLILP